MKIYGADKTEMMDVSSIQQDGPNLVIKGKIYGTMPMSAVLRPEELRKSFKLLNLKIIWFIFTMLFRKSEDPSQAKSII